MCFLACDLLARENANSKNVEVSPSRECRLHSLLPLDIEQCEYKATKKGHLRVHTLSKHEGIKFDCDQCEYKARTKSNPRVHTLSKHEGVIFDCDHCEYTVTQKGDLRVHKQSKHENFAQANSS